MALMDDQDPDKNDLDTNLDDTTLDDIDREGFRDSQTDADDTM